MEKKYRKIGLFLLSGLFSAIVALPLHAQTADKLEALLGKQALSWQEAAAFILEASDLGVFNESGAAFKYASEQNWLPKNAASADTASLNGIALLLMRSFNLKGGIFYSIAKSPHHAYRELCYKGIIRGDTDPDMPVSGRELLLISGRILSIKENEAGQGVKK